MLSVNADGVDEVRLLKVSVAWRGGVVGLSGGRTVGETLGVTSRKHWAKRLAFIKVESLTKKYLFM